MQPDPGRTWAVGAIANDHVTGAGWVPLPSGGVWLGLRFDDQHLMLVFLFVALVVLMFAWVSADPTHHGRRWAAHAGCGEPCRGPR